MNALLEADDGFPVGMVCKIVAHGDSRNIGFYCRATSPAMVSSAVVVGGEHKGRVDTFYGQDFELVHSDGAPVRYQEAFLPISFLRPATNEELQELNL